MWYHRRDLPTAETIFKNVSCMQMISEKPLTGLKVLVTRSKEQAEKFRDLLLPLGAEISEIPVIEISSPEDFADLDQALQNLSQYNWLIFASKNAVEHTLARARTIGVTLGNQSRSGAGAKQELKVAAVGPATAAALIKHGLTADFCPSNFVAEFLVEEFPGYPNLEGTKVFWPKANIGRTLIADKLTAAGAQVDTAIAYVTGLPAKHMDLARQLVDSLEASEIDVITLASAQSARNLAELIKLGLPGADDEKLQTMMTLLKAVKIAAIGPITAEAARDALGKVDVEAAEYTLAGLTEALLASLKFPQKEQ
jgi:uroporphyrinogen III methyltransferase / synthase